MYNVCIINRVLTHHCWWFVGGLMADFDWWWILHLYNGEYWRTVNIDEWWILTNGECWLMKINYFKWVIIWIFGYWLMVNIATTDGEYYGSFKNRKPIGGWLLWITDGRANPLMDCRVVGVVLFGVATMVAVVTWSVISLTTSGCSVV